WDAIDRHSIHMVEEGPQDVFRLGVYLRIQSDLVNSRLAGSPAGHSASEVHPRSEAIGKGELLSVGEPNTWKHQNIVRVEGIEALLHDSWIGQRRTVDVHGCADVRLDGFDLEGHIRI